MMQPFTHPDITAKGEQRAWVDCTQLRTLWFNTGTLCNLACANCYIESTPKNDRLVYLTCDEVRVYLDEITQQKLGTREIGFTGGEPFMNPDFLPMLELCLSRGFDVLVLTNAMRPMMKCADSLLVLQQRYTTQLTIRVSIDHYSQAKHEEERGARSWDPMILGLKWLSDNDFTLHAAGRTYWGESEAEMRAGYHQLFAREQIAIDADNTDMLILFPEMDEQKSPPEITTACWDIVGVKPNDMMCATSRMVVKQKGDDTPSIMACTLLAYDQQFNTGIRLQDSITTPVKLNHPHCATFCVLGGGSCGG